MSVTALRPRRPHARGRRQLVKTLLPAGMVGELRLNAASRGFTIEELVMLILADYSLKLRRKRNREDQRAAIDERAS